MSPVLEVFHEAAADIRQCHGMRAAAAGILGTPKPKLTTNLWVVKPGGYKLIGRKPINFTITGRQTNAGLDTLKA